MISNRWKHDTSQNWEYLAKNYDNLTTTLIFDETLLKLGVHILSTGYLKDGTRFTKVTKHDNICFDHKMVENKNAKEDGKKASKKRA